MIPAQAAPDRVGSVSGQNLIPAQAAPDRVGSVSGQNLIPAQAATDRVGGGGELNLPQLFGMGDAPAVQIKYAPPCPTERADLFNPEPRDVVRAICRHLKRGPDEWLAIAANTAAHDNAQSWVLDVPEEEGGRRLAVVNGLSFAWLNAARQRQINAGWMPGRRIEVVS